MASVSNQGVSIHYEVEGLGPAVARGDLILPEIRQFLNGVEQGAQ